MRIEENYSLLGHNTFGIDVKCRRFLEYDTIDDLSYVIGTTPLLHIGSGSNLLFMGDYEGTVLHCNIQTIEKAFTHPFERKLKGTERLRVGAGMVWDDFVAYTLEHGYYGLENLSLIPGEVGASAVQNIGAYGVEAKDYIDSVECVNLTNGRHHIFFNAGCDYSYRHSIFKTPEYRGKWAVLYVTFRLSTIFKPKLEYGGIRAELERQHISVDTLTAQQLRQVIIDIRRAKLPDPQVQGNAGSFFMNPVVPREQFEELLKQYPAMPHYEVDEDHVKIPAGWMIEQCGWKGKALGPAAVHDRQALVLVNLGGATGADIVALCQAVCRDVKERFGIDLHPEVNFIE